MNSWASLCTAATVCPSEWVSLFMLYLFSLFQGRARLAMRLLSTLTGLSLLPGWKVFPSPLRDVRRSPRSLRGAKSSWVTTRVRTLEWTSSTVSFFIYLWFSSSFIDFHYKKKGHQLTRVGWARERRQSESFISVPFEMVGLCACFFSFFLLYPGLP